jgi:RNA-dependent RNA polymerase
MDIFMRNIAFSANEIDIRIVLAEKLHRPPFPTDPPLNFHVHLFNKKGCGMLTLPTQEVGDTFLLTYGHTRIMVKGRVIEFRLSDKPVNEGRVRHIRSIPWEDPKVLERRNRQKAKDSQPIKLQGFGFGHFCRDRSFLVDSDTLGNGTIACELDLRQINLQLQQEPTAFDRGSKYGSTPLSVLLKQIFPDARATTFTSSKIASYTPSQIKTVIATDPSQTPHLVILDSDTPPIFKLVNIIDDSHGSEDTQSYRMPSLRDDRRMPPSCHSLCLTFSSHDEILIFLERCRKLGLSSVQIRGDGIRTRHVSHIEAITTLARQLPGMKFELAFEIEKAVLNGDLEPSEILSLSKTIHSLSSTPSGLPPAAFRYFVTTLQGFHPSRPRHMHSRSPMFRAAPLSLSQQLINATKNYSVKSSSKITPYLVSPATFESYHLIVTPTSTYLEGPIADQSNSVLRRFGNHECFLRVSIQDERRSKLRREPGIDISKLLKSHFRGLLTNGLDLAGRRYEFLGYSMSGLKEHSVWFVTPFESNTGRMDAAKIRKKLVRPYSDSKL